MIESLSHMTFIVRDLDKMEQLLKTIFDALKVYDSGADTFSLSKERFFTIGELWIAVMEGEPLPEKSYNHIAFRIPPGQYSEYRDRIHSLGLEVLKNRTRVDGEGQSIYFYDYDNHLFELHTGTLNDRLERYTRKKQ